MGMTTAEDVRTLEQIKRADAVKDLEKKAIARIQEASFMSLSYYEKPLVLTDSGGQGLRCLPSPRGAGGYPVRGDSQSYHR